MIKDGHSTYGSVSKIMHWTMAALIIGLVLVGWTMDDAPPGEFKWFLYGAHKSVGLTVLVLTAARLIWRLLAEGPQAAPGPRWAQITASSVHAGLYIFMVLMPLSGLLMSLYGGHAVSFFRVFSLDPLSQGPTDLGAFYRRVHGWSSYGLVGLFGLHIGGALFHHIVLKDGTMARMIPWINTTSEKESPLEK